MKKPLHTSPPAAANDEALSSAFTLLPLQSDHGVATVFTADATPVRVAASVNDFSPVPHYFQAGEQLIVIVRDNYFDVVPLNPDSDPSLFARERLTRGFRHRTGDILEPALVYPSQLFPSYLHETEADYRDRSLALNIVSNFPTWQKRVMELTGFFAANQLG
ncbi:hypothetical protein IPJ72_03325 [Candidatus Peregrinibacteria bacterium]|nr:MAG: hypothetical protein IPJ72_03325 [Candidatus Peregrinibacteria bacterium]